jgi:PAS domain S-box-containing protein
LLHKESRHGSLPLEGNEKTLGHDLLNDPRANVRADVQRAIRTGTQTFSGPYQLRQGGLGLIVRQAIFVDEFFWGLIAMVIDMPPIIEASGVEWAQKNYLIGLRTKDGKLFWGDERAFSGQGVVSTIALPESSWELGITPKVGLAILVANETLGLKLSFGAFLLISVTFIYSAMTRQSVLENTVRIRTNEVRASEERYRRLSDLSPVGVFQTDAGGDCVYANERWQEFTGLTEEQARGKGWEEALHPVDRERVFEEWYRATERKGTFSSEYRFLKPDGQVTWVYGQSSPELDGDGEIIGHVGTVTDITELKALEEQLLHAQRMEAVGQLTGGVAHDFNNLLGVMIGNTEMLGDRIGGDAKAGHNIAALTQAIDRASSLTSRLLAFSRQQKLSPVAADVTELIGGLKDMLQRTLGETVDLRVDVTPDLWPATIDPPQFENALVNLAVNARDAMAQGGKLTIETANVTLDETYAEQHEEVTPGDYVMAAVSDTGTGMAPEVLEKVFEPFFTTKDVGKGSGLGLSMVYGFVKQSNGHVTIYSETGHGTTVKLYMPRYHEAAAKQAARDDPPEFAPGSERILVVEDDEGMREISVTILKDQGYEVVEAADGGQAIRHLENGDPFDLLFTDVVLPGGLNGVEIAEQAKRIQPGIKVLYTTGYAENAVVHHGRLAPGVTLVNKPYRRAELLEKVRAILDREDG